MNDPTSPDNIPGVPVTGAAEPAAAGIAAAPEPDGKSPAGPAATAPDFADPARFARQMSSRQFDIALDYMFRLDGYDADLEVIADIRSAHPAELAEAQKTADRELGTVSQFRDRAVANFRKSGESSHVETASPGSVQLWGLALAAFLFLPAAAVYAAGFGAGASLAAGFGAALIFRILVNPPAGGGEPKIADSDWTRLHNDVVDSILEGILERRGELTAGQSEAMRRGFEHIRFIAHTTSAMATPPYAPPRLAAAA